MFFEKTKFIINKCTRDPNLALHAEDKTNKTSKNFYIIETLKPNTKTNL
jgi:hypothetical protein